MKENNQYILTISEESLFPEIDEAEKMLVPAVYQCCNGFTAVTQACEWDTIRLLFFLNGEEERAAFVRKLTQGRSYKALDYCNFDHNSEGEAGILEHDPSCRGVEIDLMRVDSCANMLGAGFVPPRTASELVKNSYFSSYFPKESAFISENLEEVQNEINKLKNREFFWIYEAGILYSH